MVDNKYKKFNLTGKAKRKSLNGYLTVEAAFLLPMIIWLYLVLIFTAFFLYSKCLLQQDAYIICFRSSAFTGWGDGYGEVSYGSLPARNNNSMSRYAEQRWNDTYNQGKYPAFQKEKEVIDINETRTLISIEGRVRIYLWRVEEIAINVQAAINNPVTHIREQRRER